jgi:hypothetical protein
MLKKLPFGTQVEGKKNAVFVALTAKCKIYLDYNDPSMPPEDRAKAYPFVVMMQRWDGHCGFVGGFQEEGQSFLDCAKAELREEIAFVETSDDAFEPVCAHELDRLVVHMYQLDLGEVPMTTLRKILADAAHAEHSCSEGNPTWIHLADYGRGKGLPATLASNTLASAVKEELEILVARTRK